MSVRTAMSRRIRSGVRRRLESALDRVGLVDPRPESSTTAAAPAPPAARTSGPAPGPPPRAAEPKAPQAVVAVEAAPAFEAAPVVEAAPAVEPASVEAPVGGPGLRREEVQELLDDMVRPALQSDGGDITLIDIKGGDIYVQLIGACNGCPSSTMTLRNGIERLFEEELPAFRRLVPVDGPPN